MRQLALLALVCLITACGALDREASGSRNDSVPPAAGASKGTASTRVTTESAPATRAIIPRFENRIAETLLDAAHAELGKRVGGLDLAQRLTTAEVAEHYAEHDEALRRSVDFDLLDADVASRVRSFSEAASGWQDRARHAEAFDTLLAHQRTAAIVRALLLPASSWGAFAARAELAAEQLAEQGAVLPHSWDSERLAKDILARFAAQRHELGIAPRAGPAASTIRLPREAESRALLSQPAYGVLLRSYGHTDMPSVLHDLALEEVRVRARALALSQTTIPTSPVGRQERLSALAVAISELLPRVERIVPVANLPDLELWRVESGREPAAPALEYMPSSGAGLPAVLYVNLADAEGPVDGAMTGAVTEAVLGHHLAAARGSRSAEGWSAFVTNLQREAHPPGPYDRQALRRWVWFAIDTGLHTGWSFEEAVSFAVANTTLNPSVAAREVAWISANPGRRTAFLPQLRAIEHAWEKASVSASSIDDRLRNLLEATAEP